MAAVTVEDCLKIVPNRFELSLIASYRAKQLMNGAPKLYASEKVEKNTVVALREIAAGLLDIQKIRDEIKDNIKNQELFKNFDDSAVYDTKKELDEEDITLNNGMADDSDDDLMDDDDEIFDEEEDDDYYDDLNTDEFNDDSDDELEK